MSVYLHSELVSLACEYHQRWEVENTIDEMKVHLLGRKTHIRSQRPKEVVQEIYGLRIGSKSCTVINFSSGKQHRRFTGSVFLSRFTLRVIRRALP